MAVWRQSNWDGRAEPVAIRRIGLLLLGQQNVANLEPLLLSPIPAVDGVIAHREVRLNVTRPGLPVARLRTPLTPRDLLAGRSGGDTAAYDSLLWLRPGESLLAAGQYHLLRETAQLDPGTCLLPVHYPAGAGLTLVTLEPRWVCGRQRPEAPPGLLDLPIDSDGAPEAEPLSPREDQAWVWLYRAVRAVLTQGRTGHILLEQVYTLTADRAPGIAGLAVRNGMAAALASGDEALLDRWFERSLPCRDYGEVQLMRALAPLLQSDAARAEQAITRLLDGQLRQDGPWVSGGGERSYRALSHRGRLRARQGDLKRALDDWIAAVQQNVDYLEPLRLAAEHRFHAAVLDRIGLRAHAVGRSAATADLVARVYAQSAPPGAGKPLKGQAAPGIRWEGAFFTASSLARVNRELASRLLAGGWDLSASPTEPQGYHPPGREAFRPLSERLWHGLERVDVTLRHCWPPLLDPPQEGRLVICLPWEFGAVPVAWLEALQAADQVWVYSEWVRQGVIRSGVPAGRVAVVPCGIDPQIFCPAPEPLPDRSFQFLYVGGTITRKGYDLALKAFLAEFGPDEPITLTLKDFGSDTFYAGISGREQLEQAEAATAGHRRRVTVLDAVLPDAELAALYRSAHCLLAPYRAEGFCMPALEAMACGTPAILPRFGPALDYARPETALLVEAVPISAGRELNGMPLAGEGVYCQIPIGELRRAMRQAYEDAGALAAMGRLAAAEAHAHHTWDHAAGIAARQLSLLCPSSRL